MPERLPEGLTGRFWPLPGICCAPARAPKGFGGGLGTTHHKRGCSSLSHPGLWPILAPRALLQGGKRACDSSSLWHVHADLRQIPGQWHGSPVVQSRLTTPVRDDVRVRTAQVYSLRLRYIVQFSSNDGCLWLPVPIVRLWETNPAPRHSARVGDSMACGHRSSREDSGPQSCCVKRLSPLSA